MRSLPRSVKEIDPGVLTRQALRTNQRLGIHHTLDCSDLIDHNAADGIDVRCFDFHEYIEFPEQGMDFNDL